MHSYSPIDPVLLDEANAHQLFQNVAENYLARAGGSYEHVEQLSGVPPQARVIWCLWLFLAEVGGNGVRDCLWNYCHSLPQLQEIHRSLDAVGAERMRGLLEAAIRSSLDQSNAEFLEQEGGERVGCPIRKDRWAR